MPRQSWLRYHGTGMHTAMTAVSMNSLSRSEVTRGLPSPGDPQNTSGWYETAAGRGVYSSTDFDKAHANAIPFCAPGMKIQVHIVLLLRVPGSLQMAGVLFQCCESGKKAQMHQKDENGEATR